MKNKQLVFSLIVLGGLSPFSALAQNQTQTQAQQAPSPVLSNLPTVFPSVAASPSASPSASASGMPNMPNVTPASSSSPSANAVSVSIPSGAVGQGPAAYGQNPLVVASGTTVTWTNNDSVPHTATSDTGAFDSGSIPPGQSYSFTFSQAGDFPYHCSIHGAQSMSGMIRVSP
ncbi:MAG: plastocyanin/azurin family copper-binding protein [Bdellovibrionota bacterium]